MVNYNTLTHNLKRDILKFSEKILKGLSRPEFKFVSQMIYGILNSQSCHLSKIARALEEDIRLKKVIDRLSHNLLSFKNSDVLIEGYLQTVKPQINKNSILIIDGSDIIKPCSTKMESLSIVRDGSTGEYGNGYHTLGVAALTPEKKIPISVYTRIYSASEKTFVSEDNEVLTALKFLASISKRAILERLTEAMTTTHITSI